MGKLQSMNSLCFYATDRQTEYEKERKKERQKAIKKE